MKTTVFCQGHWEMARVPMAIRGPLALPFRLAGVTRSRMHPNLCTVCEMKFKDLQFNKAAQVEVECTILFADLRGYTSLSERIPAVEVSTLLHAFYDRCAEAIWEYDGIVNKFIGDAVLAIFNFPLIRTDHVASAVRAAVDLQHRCRDLKDIIGLKDDGVGIGVGIHTGMCSLGQVGQTVRDFTAIGPVVNLTSRLQNAAKPGEIVITSEVYQHVRDSYPDLPSRQFTLKGIEHEVTGYVIDAGGADPAMS
jgi:adenylate cyclase